MAALRCLRSYTNGAGAHVQSPATVGGDIPRNAIRGHVNALTHALYRARGLCSVRQLAAGDVTPSQLTEAALSRINETRGLNAFISVTADSARAQAAASDERCASGARLGALDGVPVAIKDNICMEDVRATAASRFLADMVAPYDAHAVTALRTAGAVVVGKTNLDEFGMGSSTTFSHFGATKHPLSPSLDEDQAISVGGSSGGSAVAVATGSCVAALGSDTGGSVRMPAAHCGVVGLKPTYGRISRWGLIAYASSLDTVGILANSVRNSAHTLLAVAGHDPKDSTSLGTDFAFSRPQWQEWLDDGGDKKSSVKGLRVGVPIEYNVEELHPDVRAHWQAAAQWLADAGAELFEVSLPATSVALPAYYVIATAECSSNLSRYDGARFGYSSAVGDADAERQTEELLVDLDDTDLTAFYTTNRSRGFGIEVKRRILAGSFVLSSQAYNAYFHKAQQVRTMVTREFISAFSDVDVLLTPTTSSPAPSLEQLRLQADQDPIAPYLDDLMTVPSSLAGAPAISVPVGGCSSHALGLPVGLQLIGPHCGELELIKAAAVLEQYAQGT